jgi:hypothetical protein
MSALARCPNFERTCARAYTLASDDAPCGLLAASFFAKTKTQGKPSELDRWMLDDEGERPAPDSWRLSSWTQITDAIVARVWAKGSWSLAPVVPGMQRYRDRSWLARALFEARERDHELSTALRYAALELESESRALVVGRPRSPRGRAEGGLAPPITASDRRGAIAVVERIEDADIRLYGVTPLGLREEGFGTFFAGVLFIAQLTYVSHRLAGGDHRSAWEATLDRLEAPHRVGEGNEVSRWLISKLRLAIRNHDKLDRRLRKQDPHTIARTLIIRLTRGAKSVWPWKLGDRPFPSLELDVVAGVVSQVLTIVSQRRKNQGRAAPEYEYFGRLPKLYEDAAKIVIEVSSARDPSSADRGATLFENARALARSTLSRSSADDRRRIAQAFGVAEEDLARAIEEARPRIPELMRWLGEAVDELARRNDEGGLW